MTHLRREVTQLLLRLGRLDIGVGVRPAGLKDLFVVRNDHHDEENVVVTSGELDVSDVTSNWERR